MQANDDSISDQLVIANTLDCRDILHASEPSVILRRGHKGGLHQTNEIKRKDQCCDADSANSAIELHSFSCEIHSQGFRKSGVFERAELADSADTCSR